MNRKYIIEALNQQKYKSGLIIDDNKAWQHNTRFARIGQYINGDLHDFFDHVNDEELFKLITDRYDYIFIGEIFHVINLQTVVYNLECAVDCLNDNGVITICINEDCLKTTKTSYRKTISRIEKIAGCKLFEKLIYVDEHAKEWTLLSLQKLVVKQVAETQINDAIQIGREIADHLNKGKNINKLKSGFLQSNSRLERKVFKAVYTTNQEMLGFYLQNAIIELEPSFNHQYVLALAEFIFTNRKAINGFEQVSNLQQGNFILGLEAYNNQTLIPDQTLIASYADIFERIWTRCLKQKINEQLMNEIGQLKE